MERSPSFSRRGFLGTTLGAAALSSAAGAQEKKPDTTRPTLAAAPPAGFSPYSAPGKIIKVSKGDSLQENKLWPKPEVAKLLLDRAMIEFTGEADVTKAFGSSSTRMTRWRSS
jgi:hypothetical protein